MVYLVLLYKHKTFTEYQPPECDRAATFGGGGGGGGREGSGGADLLYTAGPVGSSRLFCPSSVSKFKGSQSFTQFTQSVASHPHAW